MNDTTLGRWSLAGVLACGAIVLAPVLHLAKERALERAREGEFEDAAIAFVGRERCQPCHQQATEAWLGSDHDLAMAPADETSVRGDFDDAVFEHAGITSRFFRRDGGYFVHTEGPGGEMVDFEISHTFGVEPLQQYLVPFPGGRMQTLSIAWDTERGEWFHLYPDQEIPADDWLHWTRGGQNWNGMCAECHSTNLRKGYDPRDRTYNTTWSEIDVSCEACHGPGGRHLEWAEIEPMARPDIPDYGLVVPTGGITSRQQVEICAPCHSRRSELGNYDHGRADLLDSLRPSLLRDGLYHADGQILDEVYVWGSFVQSKMYRNDVRCSDCHDAHSLALIQEGNDLCLQCHRADTYDSYDHHFHKKIHEGKPSDGALCVKCHMPEQPYMVIDYRADHSLRVPRPDLSLELGTPNACSMSGCHDDKPVAWSARSFEEWYGKAKKPHYGTILAAGREAEPAARDDLIRLAGDALYPAIVRATALSLLAAYPGPESTAAANRALADEEALLRLTAIEAVVPASPEELVELVSPLLFDPVKLVRTEAASRLAGLPRELFKPYQLEALAAAREEFEAAMTYSLDFSHAGFNLGNLYRSLGEERRAADYYRTAIAIDELFFPAKVNLANLLNSQGENEEAERLLREVLTAYPDNYEVAYSLGLLLAELGRLPEAAELLGRAARGLPERPRVHYNLGLASQALGRLPEAEAGLLRAVELQPENLDYLYALADHYMKRQRLFDALAVAERMIAAHPDQPIGGQIKAIIEQALASSGGG